MRRSIRVLNLNIFDGVLLRARSLIHLSSLQNILKREMDLNKEF